MTEDGAPASGGLSVWQAGVPRSGVGRPVCCASTVECSWLMVVGVSRPVVA